MTKDSEERVEHSSETVQLLPNGALMADGRMIARVVYADPGLAEALRAAASRYIELQRRKTNQ